ncbi:hypothetical protein RintRC_5449 [Richelia intracellularis]|nr:hypothetical protein RintRC_5449 [Richelia intracellularis]
MAVKNGIAESGDDFSKFSTIYQCFQTLIHPALMQRLKKDTVPSRNCTP